MKEASLFSGVKIMEDTTIDNKIISEELVNELSKSYSKDFIKFLADLMINNNLSYEDICDKIPDASLIASDENILRGVRFCFGSEFSCLPISYFMVQALIEIGNLDNFDDQMHYITRESNIIPLPFTKEEFVNTIPYLKNQKTKGSK